MAGIYFHIPFCKQACYYCDFHFSTILRDREQLVNALRKELLLQQPYLGDQTIETIYFGGGTPSLLPIEDLSVLLDDTRRLYMVDPNAECTIEGNPDDLNLQKLESLRNIGFNRLSIGIQSFHDDLLKFMNRAHDSRMSMASVVDSRRAGFENISVDLIYAIPGLSHEMWAEDVNRVIELNPPHISAYSLTIEPQTVFGKWNKKGKLTPVLDDTSASHLETLVDLLQRAGYQQYEVSNFCKPGFESKHNSSYWKRKNFLGIGPSAHSYNTVSRQHNVSNNTLYIKALAEGKIPAEKHTLTREDEVNEYLLTTLRTSWGCGLELLRKEFGYDLATDRKAYLEKIIDEDLAVIQDGHIILTRKGKMVADNIASDLFLI